LSALHYLTFAHPSCLGCGHPGRATIENVNFWREGFRGVNDDDKDDDEEDEDEDEDDDVYPLYNAAYAGHLETVNWLLEYGASPSPAPCTEGADIIQAAIMSRNTAVLEAILEARRKTEPNMALNPNILPTAAACGKEKMLRSVLRLLGYPAPETREELTQTQKEGLENNLWRVAEKGSLGAVTLFLSYLTLRNEDGTFQYYTFTNDEQAENNRAWIFNSTEDAMELEDSPEFFSPLWETILCPPQKILASNPTAKAEERDWINRRLMTAAANGALKTMKVILEKYEADINHISHKYHMTPIYAAACMSQAKCVKYLLGFPGVDLSIGNGKFANGPTALHQTIVNGERGEIVGLLLKYSGPVEYIDGSIMSITGKTRVFVVCLTRCRAPVRLLGEKEFEEFQELGEKRACFLELEVGLEDMVWLGKLQIRKSNAELKERGDEEGVDEFGG
jgi:ankyrin repeat protein